jgi:hypothetical protein
VAAAKLGCSNILKAVLMGNNFEIPAVFIAKAKNEAETGNHVVIVEHSTTNIHATDDIKAQCKVGNSTSSGTTLTSIATNDLHAVGGTLQSGTSMMKHFTVKYFASLWNLGVCL